MSTPDWLFKKPIAHRGLWGRGVPENSLAAFKAAVTEGFPIELDVRINLEGTPVVFHDATLERLCGKAIAVNQLTNKELATHPLADGSPIPTLAEVLALVGGRVPLFVEIKEPSPTENPLEKAVAALLADYNGPVAFISFSPLALYRMKTLAPATPRGLWFEDAEDHPLTHPLLPFLDATGLLMAAPHFTGASLHNLSGFRAGLWRLLNKTPSVTWTVRSQAQASALPASCRSYFFENFLPA